MFNNGDLIDIAVMQWKHCVPNLVNRSWVFKSVFTTTYLQFFKMTAADIPSFHWADYLVLTCFLVFSSGVGIFAGYRSKGKQTTKEFLKGGGDMHFMPVALSMMAAFLSAIFVLGTPGEMYAYGTMYSYLGVAYFIGYPIAAHFYLPIFHQLKLTNAYEVSGQYNTHHII